MVTGVDGCAQGQASQKQLRRGIRQSRVTSASLQAEINACHLNALLYMPRNRQHLEASLRGSYSVRTYIRSTYEHHTNNLSMVTVASILGCFCSALCTVFTLSIPRNAEELFVDDLHQTFVHQSMKHQRFTRKMGSPRPNPNPCIWKAHEKALTH